MQIEAVRPTITAPFKVGNFDQGQTRTELSAQWAKRPDDQRFLSLDDLHSFTQRIASTSHEKEIDPARMEFVNTDPMNVYDLALDVDGSPLTPTHWSIGQVAQLADFRVSELRKLPAVLAADVLNYRLRVGRNSPVKLYASERSVRAATSPAYGRVFDHEVVNAVREFAHTGDWKVPGALDWSTGLYDPEAVVTKQSTTLYASDRDVFVFLVDDRNPIQVGRLPDGSPDMMFRGFYVTNSEVGKSALKIAAFMLRAVCCNRIMWGVEGFSELNIRHTQGAPERFLQEAMPALQSFAQGSTLPLIDAVKEAKARKIAETKDDALRFLINRGFSAKKSNAILKRDAWAGAERADDDYPRTAWDMLMAITAEAREIEHADARVEVETKASDLLTV